MQATGIQADGSIIRWAKVKKSGKNLRLLDLQSSASGGNVKQLYAESAPLVSGLHSRDLMIRTIPITAPLSRKLRQALIIQAEAGSHLSEEELITLPLIKKSQATIYSTTKSALAAHFTELNHFQIDPERVSAIPEALKAFIHWKAPKIHSYFLIDMSLNASNCLWVEQNAVQKSYSMNIELNHLKQAFQEDRRKLISLKDREEIDFTSLKTGQYPTLAEEARNFRREISKLLYSFQCQRPLIFTGEFDSPFREYLLEILRECITDELKIDFTLDEQRNAICIGLAIDYLVNRQQPLQFRTGSFLSEQNWQKLGKFSTAFISCAFLLALSFYGIGSWWIAKREAEIVLNLETWTAAKDQTLRIELFADGNEPKQLVDHWLKLIEKNTKDYAFLMKAPRVAEFLHWLTTHPLIETIRSSGESISFEHLRYQLVSLPRLEAQRAPYLVKIELDFRVASPLYARQFHEMLLQGDRLIDASQEITWEVLSDRYRTSFYLKNENNGNV